MFSTKRRNAGIRVAPPTSNTCMDKIDQNGILKKMTRYERPLRCLLQPTPHLTDGLPPLGPQLRARTHRGRAFASALLTSLQLVVRQSRAEIDSRLPRRRLPLS